MSAAAASVGFWGKLPARGDFVRHGLGRSFTDPFDAWFAEMIAASRAALGAAWDAAWQVAPVWRFAVRPTLFGPNAAIGLWMPSVDRALRAYPLVFAAELPRPAAPGPAASAWLDAAEEAGRAALAEGLVPASIAARLPPFPTEDAAVAPTASSLWWTEGNAAVPAGEQALGALPTASRFTAMLAGPAAEAA